MCEFLVDEMCRLCLLPQTPGHEFLQIWMTNYFDEYHDLNPKTKEVSIIMDHAQACQLKSILIGNLTLNRFGYKRQLKKIFTKTTCGRWKTNTKEKKSFQK